MLNRLRQNSVVGFVLVGILTVAVNLIVFQISLWLGASIYVATLLGNATSIVVNYFGLADVFKSSAKVFSFTKYILAWVTYYFLTIWLVLFFIGLNLTPLESRVLTLFILTPLNYLLQRFIIFRKSRTN
jgi:putative flippase GtrA